MTDLGPDIRHLIDATPPVTIDEISHRAGHQNSPPKTTTTTRRKAVVAVLALSATAALVVAATHTTHRSGPTTVSVHPTKPTAVPASTTPATTPPLTASGSPPYPGCRWTVPQWDPSAPASIKAQKNPGYWTCPGDRAEAQSALKVSLPTPTLPPGWKIQSQNLGGGPSSGGWALTRTWTPQGQPPSNQADEQLLTVRVSTPQTGRWPFEPINYTLANGAQASAALSTSSSMLTWAHAGVDYTINATGLNPTAVLAAANSLT